MRGNQLDFEPKKLNWRAVARTKNYISPNHIHRCNYSTFSTLTSRQTPFMLRGGPKWILPLTLKRTLQRWPRKTLARRVKDEQTIPQRSYRTPEAQRMMIDAQVRRMLPGEKTETIEAVAEARREIWGGRNGRRSTPKLL